MPKIKFTQRSIARLPFPEKGQIDYFDQNLPGFGIRVGRLSRTYFVQKKIQGRDIRKSIGKVELFTLEEARELALDLLQQMRKGINPTEKERQERIEAEAEKLKDISMRSVFDDMLVVKKKLKPRTTGWYLQMLELYFSDWMDQPLRSITDDMVVNRHREVTESAGKGAADGAFRTLRTLWNFARVRHKNKGIFEENPVGILGQLKLWHKLPRRTRHVEDHQLGKVYAAIAKYSSMTTRDYLLLLLFTGMRRSEAAALEWSAVDFEARSLTVKDTKNGLPLMIPLNTFLYDLLLRRFEECRENKFVFPGEGSSGHLVEPKRAIEAIEKETGVKFSPHDLRRTLISVATDCLLHPFIIKKLVNHSVDEGDVTQGYLVTTLNRLRAPSQQLCDALMELCRIPREPAKVLQFPTGVLNKSL